MRRPEPARFAERLWYGGGAGALALAPLATLFGLVTGLRRAAYRRGWLRSRSAGVPVIVVGNISVGGTGKTPVCAWVAAELAARGRRPGIVSRGFGGTAGRRAPHVVDAETDTAELVGDEPLLLARATGVPVCVSRDRVAGARWLVAAAGVDCVIADDGLQHYRLARDVELAVVDAARGLGNGRLLPAGPLREPADRLDTVDLVLVNGDLSPPRGVGFSLVPGDAVPLGGGAARPLAAFAGLRVLAVAGIGHPARFLATLESAGIEVDAVPVADHGRVDLAALGGGADRPVLMTAKDAVKYPDAPAQTWYVPVSVEPAPAARAALGRCLERAFARGARP